MKQPDIHAYNFSFTLSTLYRLSYYCQIYAQISSHASPETVCLSFKVPVLKPFDEVPVLVCPSNPVSFSNPVGNLIQCETTSGTSSLTWLMTIKAWDADSPRCLASFVAWLCGRGRCHILKSGTRREPVLSSNVSPTSRKCRHLSLKDLGIPEKASSRTISSGLLTTARINRTKRCWTTPKDEKRVLSAQEAEGSWASWLAPRGKSAFKSASKNLVRK